MTHDQQNAFSRTYGQAHAMATLVARTQQARRHPYAFAASIVFCTPLIGALTPAQALEAGDRLLRFGPTVVAPNDDSGPLTLNGDSFAPAGAVGVKNGAALSISATYMVSSNVGVELLAATPFRHDVTLASVGTIAETQQLPPTLSLQWHFDTPGPVRPYLGAGINYTTFFNSKTKGALRDDLGFTRISLKDSVGWSLQAGLDIDLNDRWFVGASLYYMAIDTTATIRNPQGDTLRVNVDIDPWAIMLGAGVRF
ncbi:MAG: OmpW/AlkL family protein [Thioalkalivibrionaceae bacterium]